LQRALRSLVSPACSKPPCSVSGHAARTSYARRAACRFLSKLCCCSSLLTPAPLDMRPGTWRLPRCCGARESGRIRRLTGFVGTSSDYTNFSAACCGTPFTHQRLYHPAARHYCYSRRAAALPVPPACAPLPGATLRPRLYKRDILSLTPRYTSAAHSTFRHAGGTAAAALPLNAHPYSQLAATIAAARTLRVVLRSGTWNSPGDR